MIRRLPIVPTLVVLLAAAGMVWLGVWQLHRRVWKDNLLALYAANAARPPIAFPQRRPLDEALLYRRSSAFCLEPVRWDTRGGRGLGGVSGWRHIAWCRTGAEGPGLAIDVGVSSDFTPPAWRGGLVRGTVTTVPTGETLIGRLFARAAPAEPMLVADTAPPGLRPTEPPSPADIPNNHLAYAVQWFIFAGLAVAIYALALRRRWRAGAVAPRTRRR